MDIAGLQLQQDFWADAWHCPQIQFCGCLANHFIKGDTGSLYERFVGIHDVPVSKADDKHGIRALSEDRGEFSLGQA